MQCNQRGICSWSCTAFNPTGYSATQQLASQDQSKFQVHGGAQHTQTFWRKADQGRQAHPLRCSARRYRDPRGVRRDFLVQTKERKLENHATIARLLCGISIYMHPQMGKVMEKVRVHGGGGECGFLHTSNCCSAICPP